MNTSLSVQSSPTRQFFIGFAIGVGIELAVSAITSFIFQIVMIMVAVQSEPDMIMIGAINIGIPAILLITTLVVVQKMLKNKLLTVGVAIGWITVKVLTSLTLIVIFNFAGLK